MATQVQYLCLHDAYVMDRDRRLVPWLAKRKLRHGLTAGCELQANLAKTSQFEEFGQLDPSIQLAKTNQ